MRKINCPDQSKYECESDWVSWGKQLQATCLRTTGSFPLTAEFFGLQLCLGALVLIVGVFCLNFELFAYNGNVCIWAHYKDCACEPSEPYSIQKRPKPKFVQTLSQRLFLRAPVKELKFVKNLSKLPKELSGRSRQNLTYFSPLDWNPPKQSPGQILDKLGCGAFLNAVRGRRVSKTVHQKPNCKYKAPAVSKKSPPNFECTTTKKTRTDDA